MSLPRSAWWEQWADRCRQDAEGWQVCSGLALHEAEQVLDWLRRIGDRSASRCRLRKAA